MQTPLNNQMSLHQKAHTSVFLLMIATLFLASTMLFGFNSIAYADMGEKPSIMITLQNMDTDNYVIDLFVYDKRGDAYESPLDYNGEGLTEEQQQTLHELNYDGWISEGTRWDYYLLFADCSGHHQEPHWFSYFGTPETYKVLIINYDTEETKISDVIHREDFASKITIDVNTMDVKTNTGGINSNTVDTNANTTNINTNAANTTQQSHNVENIFALDSLLRLLLPLIVTIVVEIIIALIMRIRTIREIKIIALANLLTNIVLQLVLICIPIPYMYKFVFMEIVVIIIEYLIYSRFFHDIEPKKIAIYTLIANIVTALLTFVII